MLWFLPHHGHVANAHRPNKQARADVRLISLLRQNHCSVCHSAYRDALAGCSPGGSSSGSPRSGSGNHHTGHETAVDVTDHKEQWSGVPPKKVVEVSQEILIDHRAF